MRATTDAGRYSILITDDDAGCREALREIVAVEGYRTLVASGGEEALDIVRDETVHLALFDMNMPAMTGLEVLQLARQFRAMLPCILVTADATAQLLRQAHQAQVYSVIPKPVSRPVVVYTLVRALVRFYGSLLQGD